MGLILSEESKTSHSITHGAAAAANLPGQSRAALRTNLQTELSVVGLDFIFQ